jgi:hypothetical protein
MLEESRSSTLKRVLTKNKLQKEREKVMFTSTSLCVPNKENVVVKHS